MRRRSLCLYSSLPSFSALRSSLRTMDRSDTPRAMSDTSFGVPRIVETRSYMAVETWIPAVATPAMLARRESGSISKLVFQDVRRAVGKLALLFSLYAGRRDGLATFLIQPNRGVECTIVVEPRGRLWGAPCSHRGEICFKLQGRHSETASGWFHVPQVSTFRCGRREFFPLFSSRVCLSVWVNCASFLYASWPWLFLVAY